MFNTKVTVARLSKRQSEELLKHFKPKSKAYNILSHLLKHKSTPTADLCKAAKANYAPSIVGSILNPKLLRLGFSVCCEKPLSINVPNQDRYFWSLCKIKEGG
jgi:hypothetical protein